MPSKNIRPFSQMPKKTPGSSPLQLCTPVRPEPVPPAGAASPGAVIALHYLDVLSLHPARGVSVNGQPLEPGYGAPLGGVGAHGAAISCLEGTVWITQQNSHLLTILKSGESHIVQLGGEVHVQAVRPSRIALAQPA